ncbi:MAG: hypothetical protein AABW67_02140 [Nanoarchaeota archaeon]
MIIGTMVKIGLGRNIKYLKEKGYKIPTFQDKKGRITTGKGNYILVKIKDLPPRSNTKLLVRCDDCGKERMKEYSSLFQNKGGFFKRTGETLCSKCANHRMSGVNSGQYKHGSIRYPEYRYNAKKRGIDFKITVEQFKEITSKPCHYCNGFSIDRNPKSRGNGIDRKDSDIGYEIKNCVSCCATCNFVKNNMGYKDFINYIKSVYKTIKNYEV